MPWMIRLYGTQANSDEDKIGAGKNVNKYLDSLKLEIRKIILSILILDNSIISNICHDIEFFLFIVLLTNNEI